MLWELKEIKWLLKRLKPYTLFILLSLAGSVLEAVGTAGVSLLIKSLVDKVFLLKAQGEVLKLVLSLMGFVLLSQLGNLMVSYFSNLYTEKEMLRLRKEAYEKFMKVDYSAFLSTPAGEFVSRMLSDMSLYKNLIGSYLVKLLRDPFSVVFLSAVLIYRDWLLTLSLGFLLPLLALAVKYFSAKRGKHIKRSQESFAELSDKVFSSFAGFESIKSFSAEHTFKRFFEEENSRLFRSSLKSSLYFALNSVFNYTLGYLVVAFVMLYGSYRILEGSLTPGDFVSYLTALVFLQNPLVETQKGIVEVRSSLPVIKRIKELLELPEEKEGKLRLEEALRLVEAKDLSLKIGGKSLLSGISFTIRRGEKVGIMGETGSGKSTLLKVFAGFLPYKGSLKINGVELRDIEKRSLRGKVLYLSQEPFVYPGSVRDNLLLAGEDVKEEEILKALMLARCDFVKDLEQKVSPKELSGGEKQRLALARVFLRKDFELLLLDEATSALDAKTEREVLENLFEHCKDKTLVVVAHRFSNLLLCDRVLVMEEGNIAFEGKPKEAIDRFLQSP